MFLSHQVFPSTLTRHFLLFCCLKKNITHVKRDFAHCSNEVVPTLYRMFALKPMLRVRKSYINAHMILYDFTIILHSNSPTLTYAYALKLFTCTWQTCSKKAHYRKSIFSTEFVKVHMHAGWCQCSLRCDHTLW